MAANTTALIKTLRERVNKILTTYYEEAPSKTQYFRMRSLTELILLTSPRATLPLSISIYG